jgi:hypothetical protein
LGTGLPAYTADHKVEGNGTDLNVTGVVSQSGVPDGFQMPVPLYADGDYLGTGPGRRFGRPVQIQR